AKLDAKATKCWNCSAPINEIEKTEPAEQPVIKKKKPHILDLFTGAMLTIIWITATGWIATTYGVTWMSIIGLAIFWIIFAVLFRLFTGDLTD
ncbi:MAG: hypothetical protein WC325_13600, partial [Candidatus Bathyarchaeia archaeon]